MQLGLYALMLFWLYGHSEPTWFDSKETCKTKSTRYDRLTSE